MRRPGSGRAYPRNSDPDEGIARNTAFALFVQLTTAGFTAVLTLYLTRELGPAGYGLLALAIGVGALLNLPSDFGVSQSAARFIAENRGDRNAVKTLLGSALALKLVVALLVSGALFAAAGPVADAYGTPALTWPLRGVAIALFGQSLMLLFQASFVALRRVSVNLRLVFSESAMETLASIALVLLGGGATGAAFGRGIGYAFGGFVALVLAVRVLGWGAIDVRRSRGGHLRRVAGYAGALLIIDAAFTLFNAIDVLVIGALVGTVGVGLFEAPTRLVTFLHYPGYAVANGITPRLARTPGHEPDVDSFRSALRYLIIFQAALTTPVAVWATPIVDLLLGAEYAPSANVLRALAPFVFLSGLAPLVSLAVNYIGEVRKRIPLAVAALLVDFAIAITLVPEIGIVAGAIGSSLGYLIYVPGHLWICKQALGIPLRPLVLTLGRSLCAGVAMALVLLAFGTGELSLVGWVVGPILGTGAFLAVLILTRELSVGELRTGAEIASTRLRRSRDRRPD